MAFKGTVSGDYLWLSDVLWISIGFSVDLEIVSRTKNRKFVGTKMNIKFFSKIGIYFFGSQHTVYKDIQPSKRTSSTSKKNISKNCESEYQQRPIVDAILQKRFSS